MKAPFEVLVYLDIHGFTCLPSDIGDVVGLQPTETNRAGDEIARTARKRSENRWQIRIEGTSNKLSDCVRPLLAMLDPVAESFSQLPDDAEVQILCVVYDRERSVILGFDPDVVAAAAAIGAALNVDYYDLTSATD